MSNFKSLSEFKNENPSLEQLSKSNLGSVIGGQQSYDCENRSTMDKENCGDSQSRTRKDGGSWSIWVQTKHELVDGTWQQDYTMPC